MNSSQAALPILPSPVNETTQSQKRRYLNIGTEQEQSHVSFGMLSSVTRLGYFL